MDLKLPLVAWQIAAGDGGRDYSSVFLEFGVILIGPGSPGPYSRHADLYNLPNELTYRPFIRPFAEEVGIGDLIILKKPQGNLWEIIAVGKVAGPYEHAEAFADVDGWDLQHSRIVNWKIPSSPVIIAGLRRGTLSRVYHQGALEAAHKVWLTGICVSPIGSAVPSDTVEVDEVTDALIGSGLPTRSAAEVADTIWRLRRLAKWYSAHSTEVSEHEIRTFLIIPLLTSLGWAEQRIKVEWRSIDVALFDFPYKAAAEPAIIIESKRIFNGLRFAPNQAISYACNFGGCKRFIVSDGIRYKLFSHDGERWHFSAYMNLLEPKRYYPLDKNVAGSIAFFCSVLPGRPHNS